MQQFLGALAKFITLESITAVLVFVTIYYAYLTRETVKAMEEQNDRLTRPYVTVQPIRDDMDFLLQVKNSGRTAAENLSLDIDEEFHRLGNEDFRLADVGLFEEKVGTFAPGAEVYYKLGLTSQFYDDDFDAVMPRTFTVTVHYTYGSTEVTKDVEVNLNQFSHELLTRKGVRKEVLKLREEVKEVKKLLSNPPENRGS